MRPHLLLCIALAFSCKPGTKALTLYVNAKHQAVAEAFIAPIPMEGLSVVVSDDPEADAKGGGMNIAWVEDLDCVECYSLEGKGKDYQVHAGDILGLQYGLADLFEQMGVRFLHPHKTVVPERFTVPAESSLGLTHKPESKRRGLHLHTIHPTEAHYDFWTPGADSRADASLTMDWVIKNRGNHLQWVALDNITSDAGAHASWAAHTTSIIEEAHARGLTTGLAIQLFGQSNLQQGFDLVDGQPGPETDAERARRLDLILGEDLDFDLINLSFGEFFGAEPDEFVASAEQTYDAIQAARADTEVTATIHVGNFDDLRVTYQGQEMLYYFLVTFADRPYVPWIHTVMYYNLFEDAGLAYLHDEFDEHREFLLNALQQGDPVAYFPESAYWVAFDVNVPTYNPLYMRSRWTDYDRIANAGAPLQEHVLFSSGWEWGYWQNDLFTLREGYERTDEWGDTVTWMYEPWGDELGPALAEAVIRVGDIQHEYLLIDRLAPYFAGRDGAMDAGERLGIYSQPDRPSFTEVAAYDAATRQAFQRDVVAKLDAFAEANNDVASTVFALDAGEEDPFVNELRDGLRINTLRAQYISALYQAAQLAASPVNAKVFRDQAADLRDSAKAVVSRRHAALFDPNPEILTTRNENATIYDFGYLEKTDTLCYWERELIELDNLLDGTSVPVPGCVL